ncbi:MAG: hypothetical protein WCG36_06470, partial [bacterium]
WVDQERARRDPFGADIPQVPVGALWSGECVFDELGLPQDMWRFFHGDEAWALDLSRRYNDLSEKIVGLRLLNETPSDKTHPWPKIKELHDIFEARNVWEGGATGSWWLQQSANTPAELSALLDRVEARLANLRDFLFPENWEEEKQRQKSLGRRIGVWRGQRGPCTFACSVFGAENLLMLYYDDPELMRRFSDLLGVRLLSGCVLSRRRASLIQLPGPEAGNGMTTTAPCSMRRCMTFLPCPFTGLFSRTSRPLPGTRGSSIATPPWGIYCR